MSEWNNFLISAQRSLFSQAHTHRIFIERIMCEVSRGGRVLEAGCGLAYLSKLLADAGYEVTAGDLNEDVLASAMAKGLTVDNLKFVKLDLMDLRSHFEPDSFDVVVHSGVMEHFSDDLIVKSFREQRAVARAVIFKVPNSNTRMGTGHFGDERFLPNAKWMELLKKAGYMDVRIYGGESSPAWMYFMPSVFHLYPKSSQSAGYRRVLERASLWRRYLSKHSIFVCS